MHFEENCMICIIEFKKNNLITMTGINIYIYEMEI